MANVILFHSVLGLRPVEVGLANEWRAAGHDVTLPDLFGGQTAETYEGGFAILERIALDTVEARAAGIAETMSGEVVIAGVSMGAGIASHVWKRKPNAKGILFLAGTGLWPDKVNSTPVQVHAARPEPFDDEEWFTSWKKSNPGMPLSLYRYDNVGHYFLDKSLTDFDAEANKSCRKRCLKFLRQLSNVR